MVQRSALGVSLCLCGLLLCFAVTAAYADDIVPPTWRGEEGTTVQSWEFVTGGTYNFMTMRYEYDAPDGALDSNPYGTAEMEVWPGVAAGGYLGTWGGRTGVWDATMQFEAEIPNSQIPNVLKEIWVQLTWAAYDELYEPTVSVVVDPCYTVGSTELVEQTNLGPTGVAQTTPWYLSVYRIYVRENPPIETVRIDGPITVDRIVIDTWCTVPEPAALLLLGLGGMALLLRRRPKQ